MSAQGGQALVAAERQVKLIKMGGRLVRQE